MTYRIKDAIPRKQTHIIMTKEGARKPGGTPLWVPVIFTLVGLLTSSCGTFTTIDSGDAGRTVTYAPGVPNFDMEAVPTLRDEETGVDLYISIPYVSLIFRRAEEGGYRAEYQASLQIQDRRGREVINQETWKDELQAQEYEKTQQFEFVTIKRRLPIDPGEYVIEVSLQDNSSNAVATRRQRVEVPNVEQREPALSRVRVEARRDNGPFEPIVSLHVPENLDSLRAVVELFQGSPDQSVDVQMTLLRFRSDDAVASLPYWLSPTTGSLAHRGINYRRSDTLQVTRRTLQNVDESVAIEFFMPPLEQGNYRITVDALLHAIDGNGEDVRISQQRDLSIKSPDFPRVTMIDELVDALAYVAYDRELNQIRNAESVEEKRKRFDAFWGSLVGSRQVAANLMTTYYSRVEEANLLFSTHKEGWKTDRGMVYIVLGAPLYIENLFDAEVWHYSYGDRDLMNKFVFERVRSLEADVVFDNFILVRRPFFERTWSRAIDRWRSGAVL